MVSKIAEDCVVTKYIAPAILRIIDPNQYGVMLGSSTTLAVISMIHEWTQVTDGTGSAVRIILFNYKKIFDLVDRVLLSKKLAHAVARRTTDFLYNRKQRVKLSIRMGKRTIWNSLRYKTRALVIHSNDK